MTGALEVFMRTPPCPCCGERVEHGKDCPLTPCPECGGAGFDGCKPDCPWHLAFVAWYGQFPTHDMDGSEFDPPEPPEGWFERYAEEHPR
jgi:hypothetical protein